MTTKQQYSEQDLLDQIQTALSKELEARNSTFREIFLTSGEFVSKFADYYYYRFEIPEGIFLHDVRNVKCVFGKEDPLVLDCIVVELENQYLTLAFPYALGPIIPQILCFWVHEPFLESIRDIVSDKSELSIISRLVLLQKNEETSEKFYSTFKNLLSADGTLRTNIAKISRNRVSYIVGPPASGKTDLLTSYIVHLIRGGKKVLYVSPWSSSVDHAILDIIAKGVLLKNDVSFGTVRLGLPTAKYAADLLTISLEELIKRVRTDKGLFEHEHVRLLNRYRTVRLMEILHEEHYKKRDVLRAIEAKQKASMEKLDGEMLSVRREFEAYQNASVMERLKRGFSKEEEEKILKKLGEKQNEIRTLREDQTSLTTTLLKLEASLPVSTAEWKEHQVVRQRIEALGGIEYLQNSVKELLRIDLRRVWASRFFFATDITTALTEPEVASPSYDVVIVDGAGSVSFPALLSLASFAEEQIVIAGDPYQVGPKKVSQHPHVKVWMEHNGFERAAGAETFHEVFDWIVRHEPDVTFLDTQKKPVSKHSASITSVLYGTRIQNIAEESSKGRVFFLDTSRLRGEARQYVGKKQILPHNEIQTKKVIDLIKHILVETDTKADEIGIIVPFEGPTLFTKRQLRINGIKNIEVGTPISFQGRRKKVIIFDTLMAEVDYSLRQLDDLKIGEGAIIRTFNTISSCAIEDLYIVADYNHFNSVYEGRLLTKLLGLLKAMSEREPSTVGSTWKYDNLEWDARIPFFKLNYVSSGTKEVKQKRQKDIPMDVELALRMKMLAKRQTPSSENKMSDKQTAYLSTLRALGLLEDVNFLSLYRSGGLLFETCLSSEESKRRLPIDQCENEKDFSSIMDKWNLLIYEKTGGSKADHSFFSRNTPESQIRWDLKYLDAYFTNDIEAIISEGKNKIATSVSKIFQELVGKPQPSSPEEWTQGYLKFLSKVEAYLQWISEQLRK